MTLNNDIKLTKLAKCAGCGAKVGAGVLSKILGNLPVNFDENLLVGYDTSDDACVYKISDELALVQTLDFFPPIVDDPYTFGQIAAANALSDIFAMGAEAKLAMNILCVSTKMQDDHIQELLRGGYEKVYEAGAIIAGGHTIIGEEPKYGLSVTGFAHPSKILRNCSAKQGDVLILTKSLGVGIITTAAKGGLANENVHKQVIRSMCELNKVARDIMMTFEVSSCTDITGFGLIGHAYEMAHGGDVTIELVYHDIPKFEGVYELAQMGILPANMYKNRNFAEHAVYASPHIELAMQDVLYDPQTSGGLLIAVPERHANKLLCRLKEELLNVAIIGHVMAKGDRAIHIR